IGIVPGQKLSRKYAEVVYQSAHLFAFERVERGRHYSHRVCSRSFLRRSRAATASRSSRLVNGFGRDAAAPRLVAASRYNVACAHPEIASTGRPGYSRPSCKIVSMPSWSGMTMSVITRSGHRRRHSATPSLPSAASRTALLSRMSILARTRRNEGPSSITTMSAMPVQILIRYIRVIQTDIGRQWPDRCLMVHVNDIGAEEKPRYFKMFRRK